MSSMPLMASVVVGLGLGIAAVPAAGQSLLLDSRHDNTISLEILKPNFEAGPTISGQVGFFTQAYYLTLRYTASKGIVFVADLPFANADDAFSRSPNTVGNPYIGIETQSESSAWSGEFGVRLPVASENNAIAVRTGVYSDIARWQAFSRDVMTVKVLANGRWRSESGIVTRVRFGPSFWIPTRGVFFFMDYGTHLGYEGEKASVIGGLTGRAILSVDGANIGERTLHQFDVGGSLRLGKLRPGMTLRFPLDSDLNDIIDLVVGVHLSVDLQ